MEKNLVPFLSDVDWQDDWVKAAKKGRHRPKPGDEGLFPKPLSTATIQYNMRQIPQRGMAELLQLYRTVAWFHVAAQKVAYAFSTVSWKLYDRPSTRLQKSWDVSRRKIPIGMKALRGEAREKFLTKAVDAGELREVENHPFLDLYHEPNPVMSGNMFRSLCQKYLDVQGEVFIYKRRDVTNQVYELWPLSPTWIFRVPTQDMQFFDVSVLGRTLRVDAKDMIWMKHPELLNPYTRGSGGGEALGDTLDTTHYMEQYQKALYYNDARPNIFVFLKNASEATVRDFQDKLENAARGPLRKHRPVIYDGDEAAEIMEIDLTKGLSATIPMQQYSRDTILSIFGCPPEVAGVLQSSNRATIVAAETILARQTIKPRCDFWLDEMTRQLLGPDFSMDLLLGYDNPAPEDKDFKIEVLKAAPWIADVGEWREVAGLPDRGEQDEYYMVPVNYVPTPDASKQVVPMRATHTTTVQGGVVGSNLQAGSHFIEDTQGGVAKPDELKKPDGAGAAVPDKGRLFPGVTQPDGDYDWDDWAQEPEPRGDKAAMWGDKALTAKKTLALPLARVKKKSVDVGFMADAWTLAWDPDAHPRDENGRFSSGGGGGGKKPAAKPAATPKPAKEKPVAPKGPKTKLSAKLTRGEQAALDDYQGGAFAELNRRLRAGKDLKPSHTKTQDGLDSAIVKSKLTSDTVVYRGLNMSAGQFRVGKTFTDNGYTSTTSDHAIAEEFSGDKGAIVEIKIPAGRSGMQMQDNGTNEKELLLGRGTRFKITGKSTKTITVDGKKKKVNYVHAEVI